MKLRRRATTSADLPADLAHGPDPRLWGYAGTTPDAEWSAAGHAWSRGAGLGPLGWRALLPAEVRDAVSALGRHRRRCTGEPAPWELVAPPERTTSRPDLHGGWAAS